jgi:hypothetical protein
VKAHAAISHAACETSTILFRRESDFDVGVMSFVCWGYGSRGNWMFIAPDTQKSVRRRNHRSPPRSAKR